MPDKCPGESIKAGTAVIVTTPRGDESAWVTRHLPHEKQDPEKIRCLIVKTTRGIVRSSVMAKVKLMS